MDAKVRRHKSILICSGVAVIAFGLWSIARVALMEFFDPVSLEEFFGTQNDIPRETYDLIMFFFFLAVLVFDLLIRLYIGLSAVSEGKGKKKRIIYVIAALLYGLMSVKSDFHYIIGAADNAVTLTGAAMTIVDLTSCIAMFEITVSSISLRKLLKNAEMN